MTDTVSQAARDAADMIVAGRKADTAGQRSWPNWKVADALEAIRSETEATIRAECAGRERQLHIEMAEIVHRGIAEYKRGFDEGLKRAARICDEVQDSMKYEGPDFGAGISANHIRAALAQVQP